MPLVPAPFDVGFSDGEQGLRYYVPQGYTVQEAEQYQRGYNQGYDHYLKKAYEMSQRSARRYNGPYIDDSWIPKDGHY